MIYKPLARFIYAFSFFFIMSTEDFKSIIVDKGSNPNEQYPQMVLEEYADVITNEKVEKSYKIVKRVMQYTGLIIALPSFVKCTLDSAEYNYLIEMVFNVPAALFVGGLSLMYGPKVLTKKIKNHFHKRISPKVRKELEPRIPNSESLIFFNEYLKEDYLNARNIAKTMYKIRGDLYNSRQILEKDLDVLSKDIQLISNKSIKEYFGLEAQRLIDIDISLFDKALVSVVPFLNNQQRVQFFTTQMLDNSHPKNIPQLWEYGEKIGLGNLSVNQILRSYFKDGVSEYIIKKE